MPCWRVEQPGAADDLLAEVFLAAAEGVATYDPSKGPLAVGDTVLVFLFKPHESGVSDVLGRMTAQGDSFIWDGALPNPAWESQLTTSEVHEILAAKG